MTIGERIRYFRKQKAMTQKQVADACGMADSAIRKYESGTQVPKIETLQRIANALNIPVQQLMPENTSAAFDFHDVALDELRKKLPEGYGIRDPGSDLSDPVQIIYPDGKLSKALPQSELWTIVKNAMGYLSYELDKLR